MQQTTVLRRQKPHPDRKMSDLDSLGREYRRELQALSEAVARTFVVGVLTCTDPKSLRWLRQCAHIPPKLQTARAAKWMNPHWQERLLRVLLEVHNLDVSAEFAADFFFRSRRKQQDHFRSLHRSMGVEEALSIVAREHAGDPFTRLYLATARYINVLDSAAKAEKRSKAAPVDSVLLQQMLAPLDGHLAALRAVATTLSDLSEVPAGEFEAACEGAWKELTALRRNLRDRAEAVGATLGEIGSRAQFAAELTRIEGLHAAQAARQVHATEFVQGLRRALDLVEVVHRCSPRQLQLQQLARQASAELAVIPAGQVASLCQTEAAWHEWLEWVWERTGPDAAALLSAVAASSPSLAALVGSAEWECFYWPLESTLRNQSAEPDAWNADPELRGLAEEQSRAIKRLPLSAARQLLLSILPAASPAMQKHLLRVGRLPEQLNGKPLEHELTPAVQQRLVRFLSDPAGAVVVGSMLADFFSEQRPRHTRMRRALGGVPFAQGLAQVARILGDDPFTPLFVAVGRWLHAWRNFEEQKLAGTGAPEAAATTEASEAAAPSRLDALLADFDEAVWQIDQAVILSQSLGEMEGSGFIRATERARLETQKLVEDLRSRAKSEGTVLAEIDSFGVFSTELRRVDELADANAREDGGAAEFFAALASELQRLRVRHRLPRRRLELDGLAQQAARDFAALRFGYAARRRPLGGPERAADWLSWAWHQADGAAARVGEVVAVLSPALSELLAAVDWTALDFAPEQPGEPAAGETDAALIRARLQRLTSVPHEQLERVERLLAASSFAAAWEYADLLTAGRPLPDLVESRLEGVVTFSGWHSGLPPEAAIEGTSLIVTAARQAQEWRGLHFGRLPAGERERAAADLRNWFEFERAGAGSMGAVVQLAQALGLEPVECWRGEKSQACAGLERWQLRLAGLPSTAPFLPPALGPALDHWVLDFDRSQRPLLEYLRQRPVDPGASNVHTLVCLRWISRSERLELARWARARGLRLLVVDRALFSFVCAMPDLRFNTFLAAALPCSGLTPYCADPPSETFFGRAREQIALEESTGPSVVFGGARIGTTALLRAIWRRTHRPGEGKIALFVDLRSEPGLLVGTSLDFWARLTSMLTEAGQLGRRGQAGFDAFAAALREWLGRGPRHRVWVLVDHAEALFVKDLDWAGPQPSRPRSNTPFERLLALQEESAGRCRSVFATRNSTWRNVVGENRMTAGVDLGLSLGPLLHEPDQSAARSLVEEPLRALGYRFASGEIVSGILARTNYHPALLQLFGQRLLEHLRSSHEVLFGASPAPFLLSAEHIESLFSGSLGVEIRGRIAAALELDRPAYLLLCLVAWHQTLQDADGVELEFLRHEAARWWPAGFPELPSRAVVGLLLEQLAGGGFVRRLDGSTRFVLRNRNALTLLGGVDEVARRLDEVQRWTMGDTNL